jgi:hypothetical protein
MNVISRRWSTISPTVLLLVLSSLVFAQNENDDTSRNWHRVLSEDAEFSFDFPTSGKMIFDPKGFTTSLAQRDVQLEQMRIVNAYSADTFLSVETYKAQRAVLDSLREIDAGSKKARKLPDIRIDGKKIKQIVFKTGAAELIRTYVSTRSFIFIVDVGTRNGETPTSRKFLNSFKFHDAPDTIEPGVTKISKIPISKVTVEQIDAPDPKSTSSPVPKPNPVDPSSSLILLYSPRASYTEAARGTGVSGDIRLKVTLTPEGFIPKIVVVGKGLSGGISRQAIYNALRIKYLPKLVDGKPTGSVITLEYGFNIF